MPMMMPLVSLALASSKLVLGHSKRIWNNLTPEERKELFEILTPLDASDRQAEEGFDSLTEEGEEKGSIARIKANLPDVTYLKRLSDGDRKRLWELIKKANSGDK